jgi:hypothetical protein
MFQVIPSIPVPALVMPAVSVCMSWLRSFKIDSTLGAAFGAAAAARLLNHAFSVSGRIPNGNDLLPLTLPLNLRSRGRLIFSFSMAVQPCGANPAMR